MSLEKVKIYYFFTLFYFFPERKGKDVIYSRLISYLQWCYIYILVDGDLLNSAFANLGEGHRGYG